MDELLILDNIDNVKNNNIINLYKLNLIKTQINYYKNKLIKEIFDTYFNKQEITLSEFKNVIIRKKRKNMQPKYEYEKDKCNYILWNKGNIRQCLYNKSNDTDYCKKHQDCDNLLENAFDFTSDEEE